MTPDVHSLGGLGRVARFFSLAGLAYWLVFALVAPVTNLDSQMYNLARIELTWRAGLFNNGLFTSAYHLIFPWTFDAVHLPFLWLGWGCVLPSFACLAGTCYIAFAMMRARFSADAGWLAVISLLSLTCLVYQGSTTKNDIPLLFAGAVWCYARWRRRQEGGKAHLFWMILAIGFMAGAKTVGLLYAGVLGLWTLWELRREPRLVGPAAAGLGLAAVLFGSGETYVESARVFGHPLGPARVLSPLQNRDGLTGAVANLSRYAARSIYLGPTTSRSSPPAVLRLSAAEKSLLRGAGLTNKGNSSSFDDDHLFLFQSGLEEFSGFGPTGTIAMALMLLAGILIRPRFLWWQLAFAGLLGLGLVCLTVGYTDWSGRYLIGCYALAAVAAVCVLWEYRPGPVAALRWCFLALAIGGAVAAPLLSFNRGPAALLAALRHREQLETSAYPLAGGVRSRLRELKAATPGARLFFVTCNDSVILPLLQDAQLDPILVTPPTFLALESAGGLRPDDLVIEDYPTSSSRLAKVAEVSAPDAFTENSTRRQSIYRVTPAAGPSR